MSGNRRFREVILPSAVSMQMLRQCDVRALIDHDKSRLLARWNKGKGSLTLSIDNKGLRYSFEAPNTADGDFAVEMVKRGDVDGCSFAFFLEKDGDRWKRLNDDLYLRTVTKISRITDVTLTADPAYKQTSVGVRSKKGNAKTAKYRKISKELDERIQKTNDRVKEMEARAQQIRNEKNRIAAIQWLERQKTKEEAKVFKEEIQRKIDALRKYRGKPRLYR